MPVEKLTPDKKSRFHLDCNDFASDLLDDFRNMAYSLKREIQTNNSCTIILVLEREDLDKKLTKLARKYVVDKKFSDVLLLDFQVLENDDEKKMRLEGREKPKAGKLYYYKIQILM